MEWEGPDMKFYLTSESHPRPLRLEDGVNYLSVPVGKQSETLWSFYASGTLGAPNAEVFLKKVDLKVQVPDDHTIVLFPYALKYHAVLRSQTFRASGGVEPLSPERVQHLLASLQKAENARAWSNIVVAGP